MKKIFILMMALMMSFTMNAQTAIETPKFFDNWYVGVGAQTSTPLSFNSVFPLNGAAAVVLGKELTPVFGVSFEDNVWFSSHGNKYFPMSRFDFIPANFNPITGELTHNVVRGNYLGLNGTINFNNLFCGYRGVPRVFEVQGIVGLGWSHVFTPNNSDRTNNDLGAKTGVNFNFNLGTKKAHSLYIQPAVLWNLTNPGSTHNQIAFNSRGAQLAVQVGYAYHFKTSNGTHYFKTLDVGIIQDEINCLNTELAKKPREVVHEVEVVKEVKVVETINTSNAVIYFSFDSSELDDRAKEELDKIGENGVYCIDGYASSEGSTEYNLTLSQKRADAVKEYLESRGCKIESAVGHGVQFGTTTGRVAVVTVK